MKMMTSLALLLLTTIVVQGRPHHHLSRHLVTNDLSMLVLVANAQTTAGPFDEEESDYITSSDMTEAGRAGAPGVSTDLRAVVEGIPLTLTMNVYAIAPSDMTVGYEYEGVEVFIWHTDALGVYSAVESAGTEGQKWLRGRQVTDSNGVVTFETILPGPYVGRALHYHIRFRLPGESNFVATSQLFIKNSDWEQYRDLRSYPEQSSAFVSLENDRIFNNLGASSFQDLLTLSMDGSFATGVTSQVAFGLFKEDAAVLQQTTSSGSETVTPAPAAPVQVPAVQTTEAPTTETSEVNEISATEQVTMGSVMVLLLALLAMWGRN